MDDTQRFSLTPRRTAEKGDTADQEAEAHPDKRSPRAAHDNSDGDDCQRQVRESAPTTTPEKQESHEPDGENPRHDRVGGKPPVADKNRGGTINEDTRDWGQAVERAELLQILRRSGRIQERMAQNGLHDSEPADHDGENHIDDEKAPQILFGIEQRIAYENERNIVEIQFQAERSNGQVRRRGIENLEHAKPDEHHQRQEKARPEGLHFFPADGSDESDIDDGDEEVFAKIDRHVVAEILARQIFKEKPSQEQIEAVAPVIEDGNHDGKDDDGHADVDKVRGLARDDIHGDFISAKENKNRECKGGKGTSAGVNVRKYAGHPHEAASRTKT